MTTFRRRNPLGELLGGRVAIGRLTRDAERLRYPTDVKIDGTHLQAGRARSDADAPRDRGPRRG